MTDEKYAIFVLGAAILVFPSLQFANAFPMSALLASAIAFMIADGLLTLRLVRSGGRECNPLLQTISRKIGTSNAIWITRLIGVVACLIFANARIQAALFLVLLTMVFVSAMNLLALGSLRVPAGQRR